MKKREGDQELPTRNHRIPCQTSLLERVTEDIPARTAVGIERYGTALQPGNGRAAGRDAYEEWLDLGAYIEQMRYELKALRRMVLEVADRGGLCSTNLELDLVALAREMGEDS